MTSNFKLSQRINATLIVLGTIINILFLEADCFPLKSNITRVTRKNHAKLLVLLLDGFRWDYYNIHRKHLPGFQKLLETRVHVEYVNPIFPTLSLPAWTTISTGLYPAYHNIIGNVMLKRADEDSPEMTFNFGNNSSMEEIWWQSAEPLWTTATKHGLKAYLASFSRCDVPYKGVLPLDCTGYQSSNLDKYILRRHLSTAFRRFHQGYSLAMIQHDFIDGYGHAFGPESEKILPSLINADLYLQEFLDNLELNGLQETVNIVVTSDHGMTNIKEASGTKYVLLENYITDPDKIYKVIGYGATAMIATIDGEVENVFNQLSQMPGVDVYRRKDIPEEFHIKESPLVQDILLVARPKYFIVGLKGNKQLPNYKVVSTWKSWIL